MTIEEIQEQYDELCRAINMGALKVKYSDKEVQYRSLDQMLQIKSSLEIQLGLRVSTKKRINPILDKGL